MQHPRPQGFTMPYHAQGIRGAPGILHPQASSTGMHPIPTLKAEAPRAPPAPGPRPIGILSGGGALAKDKKRKQPDPPARVSMLGGVVDADDSDSEIFPDMAGRMLLRQHSFAEIDAPHKTHQIQIPNFFDGASITNFLEMEKSWISPPCDIDGIPKSFAEWGREQATLPKAFLTGQELALLDRKQKNLQQQDEAKQRDVELRAGIRERWVKVGRIEMPRFRRMLSDARANHISNGRKLALMCQKEIRKRLQKNTKSWREVPMRAKRLAREVLVFWRRHDKEQTETKKKAEKEEVERMKREEEIREAKRQQMKLNFLLTQTELYSHFIAKNVTENGEILPSIVGNKAQELTGIKSIDEEFDNAAMEERAMQAAKDHVMENKARMQDFDCAKAGPAVPTLTGNKKGKAQIGKMASQLDTEQILMEPQSFGEDEIDVTQPTMFRGQLKSYQLKGLKWLANLHEHGINGILADEMGLGKTVQAIALLSYLAESKNAWGPFLVIAPASTLHNWRNEIARFAPEFRILPYWGSQRDRKNLRKDFAFKGVYTRDAPFHVVVTSYQLLVTDEKYFQRHRYEFMVLDEAQALKSSNSIRWKTLLGFNCRNRLLLTGTPIQNSMAELWALLHFIMPTLFDNHEEFNEWFSKDIENHASTGGSLNEHQLKRLHMIIKPFMLRRVKKDVETEMAEKVELELSCEMTRRQRYLYQGIRSNISFEDLFETMASGGSSDDKRRSLMNWVMQFRKVCNHPEIFERRDIISPMLFKDLHSDLCVDDKMENPLDKTATNVPMSARSAICFIVPRLVWDCGGGAPDGTCNGVRKLFSVTMSLWTAAHVHQSVKESGSGWGFVRLLGLSSSEIQHLAHGSGAERMVHMLGARTRLSKLCDYMPEMEGGLGNHMRIRQCRLQDSVALGCLYDCANWVPAHLWMLRAIRMAYCPKISALPADAICNDHSWARRSRQMSHVHDPKGKQLLLGSSWSNASMEDRLDAGVAGKLNRVELMATITSALQLENTLRSRKWLGAADELREHMCAAANSSCMDTGGLMAPVYSCEGSAHVHVPDYGKLVTDSGKLLVMDGLLTRLKQENHRVLIFCQMTKMMDILEDYLQYRKHSFVRLDGSSNLADRRDMVQDFQQRDDIFCFLLSTRAGGLGINLTAADTVIFYDNDWNPTQDAQAMDRTHRIGQTKQVTVYRLVTKGTVEERILRRAKQKDTIQKTVYAGNLKADSFEPAAQEMVSLLVGDEELEGKLKLQHAKAKQREKEKRKKRKGGSDKSKEAKDAAAAEGAAAEGEGADVDGSAKKKLKTEPERASTEKAAPLIIPAKK